jgi:uncharacterized protein (UPF0548 family)
MHHRRPGAAAVARHLEAQRGLPHTYDAVGATRDGLPDGGPPGFVVDRNAAIVGTGGRAFAAGTAALRRWAMFPAWTRVLPEGAPIAEGTQVCVVAHAVGLWWLAASRIVYVIDEPRRFGFAYGTLPGHVECGEERFLVEWHADDRVEYSLLAFSRPRHWAARLATPLARRLQRRFARDSVAAMRACCR